IPILMLSARGSVADRVHGIAEGADDYLTKPFSPAELVVRVKAILRRATVQPTSHEKLCLEDLVIDLDRHEVIRDGQGLVLSAVEFRLLVALVEAEGRVLSRDALLDALYGAAEGEPLDRTIDVYIRRLRDRLGDSSTRPRYVPSWRAWRLRRSSANGSRRRSCACAGRPGGSQPGTCGCAFRRRDLVRSSPSRSLSTRWPSGSRSTSASAQTSSRTRRTSC